MLKINLKNKMHPDGWVTVKQYADMTGRTPQGIYEAIKYNWRLPGVVERIRLGSSHLLRLDKEGNQPI
jgi:hypothetical protein